MTKVMIPLVTTVLFYVCAEASMADELHGIVAISVLVYIVAFFVAKMFTEVSSTATGFPRTHPYPSTVFCYERAMRAKRT